MRAVLVCLLIALAVAAKCNMKDVEYPPTEDNKLIPTTVINLDLDPKDRWTHVVQPLTDEIEALLDTVLDIIPEKLRNKLLKILDLDSRRLLRALPNPYRDEIMGIHQATKIDLGMLIVYNIFYEIFGMCTSIVAQSDAGQILHARNLDFGLFLGWDRDNKTWATTEKLRPLLFNAEFQRGGETVYQGVYYAGYVGLLTGMNHDFSITVDSRFDNTLDAGLLKWLKGDHSGHFVAFLTRDAIENNSTYTDAISTFVDAKMVGPSYIIVGGKNAGEGAVVTRGGNATIDTWNLQDELDNDSFYVLETNYDHWKKAPFFDDRRDPGMACMDQIGSSNVDFESLYNLLSAQPNLNQLTTYSALMNVAEFKMESYKQYCDHPCTIW